MSGAWAGGQCQSGRPRSDLAVQPAVRSLGVAVRLPCGDLGSVGMLNETMVCQTIFLARRLGQIVMERREHNCEDFNIAGWEVPGMGQVFDNALAIPGVPRCHWVALVEQPGSLQSASANGQKQSAGLATGANG